MELVQTFVNQVIDNIEKVIIGKRDAIEMVMVALLCEGHVLLEDVPGSGKTMLARSIATSLGIDFKRVQCTPDLLPKSTYCWLTKSIGLPLGLSRRYWKPCRSSKSLSTA
jgi:MoxR-like ATPase